MVIIDWSFEVARLAHVALISRRAYIAVRDNFIANLAYESFLALNVAFFDSKVAQIRAWHILILQIVVVLVRAVLVVQTQVLIELDDRSLVFLACITANCCCNHSSLRLVGSMCKRLN